METPNTPQQSHLPGWLRHGLAAVFSFTLLMTAAICVTYLPASQHLLIAATPVDGLSTAERLLAAKKILAFYSTGEKHLLAGYTPDEQAHLVEVSGVFKNGWRVFYALLIATFAGLVFITRRYGFPALRGPLRHACGFSAIGSLVILLVGWTGFAFFFDRFHQLVFSAAPWAFDPSVSRLVNEFPPEYFRAVVVTTFSITTVMSGSGWLMLRSRRTRPPLPPPS